MTIYSMTGFASADKTVIDGVNANAEGVQIQIEIRSVNSRFLDLSLRLPDSLRNHESVIRQLVTQKLKRGKIDLRLNIEQKSSTSLVAPPEEFLEQIVKIEDKISKWRPNVQLMSSYDVLRLYQGREQPTQTMPAVDVDRHILSNVENALSDLQTARATEGKRLAEMLSSCTQSLKKLVEKAEPLVPQAVQEQQKRFFQRWQQSVQMLKSEYAESVQLIGEQAMHERALSEMSAYALRIDIAEEISRLRSHLQEIEKLLMEGGAVGKRLEFLIQELHREANTLGSKASLLELSRISMDMKVFIEQMREQVQNIE